MQSILYYTTLVYSSISLFSKLLRPHCLDLFQDRVDHLYNLVLLSAKILKQTNPKPKKSWHWHFAVPGANTRRNALVLSIIKHFLKILTTYISRK